MRGAGERLAWSQGPGFELADAKGLATTHLNPQEEARPGPGNWSEEGGGGTAGKGSSPTSEAQSAGHRAFELLDRAASRVLAASSLGLEQALPAPLSAACYSASTELSAFIFISSNCFPILMGS